MFPGPYGEKGTRIKDWPTLRVDEATEITLEELRRGHINVALRTGCELGAIDIDGKGGVDAKWALDSLLATLPEGVAVYRSARGFGILFRPAKALGNGILPIYGAELFTGCHLVNIPPSRHPSGAGYEWLIPPGGDLPTVDLEALGLAPVIAAPRAESATGRSGPRLLPATAEAQAEFRWLFERNGIRPRRKAQELHRCLWHDDEQASLSINWDAAVFKCHAGCGQGGLAELRRLSGEPTPPLPPPTPVRASSKSAFALRVDPERERHRLVHAMKQSGHDWGFDRNTGRSKWEDVIECQVAMIKYECPSGHRLARPKSCGFPLCPICVRMRLVSDFRRHAKNLPVRLSLFVATPDEPVSDRRELGLWFRRWRRRHSPSAGIYGPRFRIGKPDVLLVLPADQVPGDLASDPCVTAVAANVTLEDAVQWYSEMFLEEISSWRTPAEMLDLLAAVKGRRRFQGFGKYYERQPSPTEKVPDNVELLTEEPKRVHRASGGSAKGGPKAFPCPICGGRMRVVGLALNTEDMIWDGKLGWHRWGIGPPATASEVAA